MLDLDKILLVIIGVARGHGSSKIDLKKGCAKDFIYLASQKLIFFLSVESTGEGVLTTSNLEKLFLGSFLMENY